MDGNIRKLNLREHIISRPGMYIGRDWDAEAINVLIDEISRTAMQPDHANECSSLQVVIHHDTSIPILIVRG